MKKILLSLFFGILWVTCDGQPNGTEYVLQPDFGDGQSNNFPDASGQWIFLNWWEEVQPIGNQTDWFGPNYMPLGNSSHPRYVMLDDDSQDYGAIAGNIRDLEYRLVQCDFAYRIYDPSDSTALHDGGTLYVLLTGSESDVRSFDADNPGQFEADGHGQVLFTFNFGTGSTPSLSGTWDSLARVNPNSSAFRTGYALNLSPTGTPGNPFTHVGLVWRAEEPYNARICIDNFHLKDVCPDCVMDRTGYTQAGCFDHTWVSSVRNNYYYYTASILDSATSAPIYQAVHQPATFSWDGVGNRGAWNGVLVPYGHPMKATLLYYSCLKFQSNVVTLNYLPTRDSGCVDQDFGGSRIAPQADGLALWPNPVLSNGRLSLEFKGRQPTFVSFTFRDLSGRELAGTEAIPVEPSQGPLAVQVPAAPPGTYLLDVESDTGRYLRLLYVLP